MIIKFIGKNDVITVKKNAVVIDNEFGKFFIYLNAFNEKRISKFLDKFAKTSTVKVVCDHKFWEFFQTFT